MRKTTLYVAVGLSLGVASTGVQAGLAAGTLLTIDPAVLGCRSDSGTPPGDCAYGTTVVGGSFFSMGLSGFNDTGLNPGSDGGIIMGQTQFGGGTHGGAPDGTETAPIDAAWLYFCNTGLHYTTVPITVIDNDVNNDGGFTQSLDMSGWTISWNGISPIDLIDEMATITCSLADCAAGSSYQLNLSANYVDPDPHIWVTIPYALHLEGSVSAVPVPAAVWLFGSGLAGLVGVARRKKYLYR